MTSSRTSWPASLVLLTLAVLAVLSCRPHWQTISGVCPSPQGRASPALDASAAMRQQCQFVAGQKTSETLDDAPDISAVKHVLVLMLENRSFDHYFSDLPNVGVQVDAATTQTNPDGKGGTVARYHETVPCFGTTLSPAHEWADSHLALAGGRMDGFVAGSGCSAMSYYTHDDLPFYYQLASTFAISDRHFAPVLGPTWPNRYFFWRGTSCGFAEDISTNASVTFSCGTGQDSLLTRLNDVHATYKLYEEEGPVSFVVASGVAREGTRSIDDFEAAVDAGNLPDVSFIGPASVPIHTPGVNVDQDDEHPPGNIHKGQAFTYRIIKKLMLSELWKTSVLFITYDESGGFYDHVQPPAACDPDPHGAVSQRDYAFDQYGFRVPLIVVSPFVKRGYVSHFDTDHTSITRFIEHWKGLGALTRRDANAWPMLDMFDFTNPRYDVPAFDPGVAQPPASETALCASQPQASCQNR